MPFKVVNVHKLIYPGRHLPNMIQLHPDCDRHTIVVHKTAYALQVHRNSTAERCSIQDTNDLF